MRRLVTALLFVALSTAPITAAKRAFTIEDLYRVRGISSVELSPDGKTIAYVLSTPDLPRGKRVSQIWVMDRDGSNARQLTQGTKSSSSPRFTPDSRNIIFSSSRDGAANLYMLPLNGGEATRLTKLSTDVADYVISEDGKKIIFTSDIYPECGADDACNKKIADRRENGPLKAHVADSLLYRHWTSWKDGTRTHTFLFDVDTKKVRDLTPGDFDSPGFSLGGETQYDLSPDGKELAFESNRDKEPASSTNADIWLLPLDGNGEARNITASNHGYDNDPKYSPDGTKIAYRTQAQAAYESDLFKLAVYDRATGTSRIVSGSFNNWINDFFWTRDGKALVFIADVEGQTPLYRLDLASGQITPLYSDRSIDEFVLTHSGNGMIYVGRSVSEPAEIYNVEFGGKRTPLTTINKAVADEVDIRPAETMWVEGAEGMKVQVFIVKPHDFDPNKKYPLILNVHGGPQSQWADAFRGDWQVYPGAGYVVAFANPHGSTGFGQPYTASISGDWGGKPFEDLMKVTDALEKLPYVDKDRMGAMGWSYGGYMMDWFEGHTTRFKAIASMMGLYDLRSFYGATEELWFPEWDLKGQPWNSELYEKWSPSNSVKNFKTPTLVISGELDYRVPYTQSLQFFTALQKMNVPSKLIIYPNAGHWPSWYEMALYYTAHLEWFHKYLGGGDPPWSTEAFARNAVFDTESGERIKDDQKKPSGEETRPGENNAKDKQEVPKASKGKKDQKPKG